MNRWQRFGVSFALFVLALLVAYFAAFVAGASEHNAIWIGIAIYLALEWLVRRLRPWA